MNSFLLSVGVAIVLALCAALVGPFLIDWNGYRHVFEARLSEMAGRPVAIGRIDRLRILPMPAFELADVRIEAAGDGGRRLLDAPRLSARAALTPLLSGEIRIEEILLDRPRIELDFDGASLRLPPPAAIAVDPERIALNLIEIRDGTVLVRDAPRATTHRLDALNLTGTATSLAGPFRAEGGALAGGALYSFRLATGRVQPGAGLRAKLAFAPADGRFEVALDGLFSAAQGRAGFAGQARIQHVPPDVAAPAGAVPWRVTATVDAGGERIALDRLVVALGAEGRAVQLEGAGEIALAAPARARAALAARQIDLDRALGAGPGEPARLADTLAAAPALLARLRELPLPLDLRLDADAVLLNGALTEGFGLAGALSGDGIEVADLQALLPGRARLAWRGRVALAGDGPALAGRGTLHARQLARLAQWLGAASPRFGPLRLKTGDAALALAAATSFGPDGIALDDVEARLDDMLVTGRIAYTAGARRALAVRLAADALDIDRYFDVVGASDADGAAADPGPGRALDIALDLSADEVTVAGIVARRLVADLAYGGGALTVNRLALGDLAGSTLSAQGRIADLFGAADGEIALRLASADPGGTIGLVRDLGLMDAGSQALLARAAALAPVELEARITAARTDAGSTFRVSADGRLAGTRLDASGRFSGRLAEAAAGEIALRVAAGNPDGDELLAQLAGLAVPRPESAAADGAAAIELTGRPADGAALVATVRAPGFAARADGTLTAGDGATGFAGTLSLDTADARLLAGLAGLDPGATGAPVAVRLTAAASGAGAGWSLDDIAGSVAGRPLAGRLSLAFPPDGPPRLDATLDSERIDIAWLLAVLLGADSRLDAGGGWPEAPFSLAATRTLSGRLDLAARRVELPWGATARTARIVLDVTPGRIAFGPVSAGLYGGALTLSGEFAEGEGGVSLAAGGALRGADVAQIAWAPRAGPVAAGSFDIAARVGGSGRSWLGLVSALDGEGSFAAAGGEIAGLSAAAFARTLDAAQRGLDLAEGNVLAAFAGHLAARPLAYRRFESEFTVANGLLAARNIALDAPGTRIRASALVDLTEGRLDSEWTLGPPDDLPVGAVPPVTLVFAGPLAAPQRSVDVHALAGFLAVQRMEASLRELEEAQAAVLERERFEREQAELQRARLERQRAERAERERAEAVRREKERLAAEAAARAEAEAEARERERLAAEAAERERIEDEARERARQDEEGRAAAAREATPSPDGAGTDAQRRRTLEELVEEALRARPAGTTFSVPATESGAPPLSLVPATGGIERRDLPPPGSAPPGDAPPAAGRDGEAPADGPAQDAPPARTAEEPPSPGAAAAAQDDPPAAPRQRSIRLELPDPARTY